MVSSIFGTIGIEVKLKHPDDFLLVKETLTRIGIPSFKDRKLFQSCHILHKRGSYAIVHFKEMFALDGRIANMSKDDLDRRNRIADLLESWDLLTIVDKEQIVDNMLPMSSIKVIPFSDKRNWSLISKYSIGTK